MKISQASFPLELVEFERVAESLPECFVAVAVNDAVEEGVCQENSHGNPGEGSVKHVVCNDVCFLIFKYGRSP